MTNRTHNENSRPASERGPFIYLSQFSKNSGILTKRISRNTDGTLNKDATECLLTRGNVETLAIRSLQEFGELLLGVRPNQAFGYGVRQQQGRQQVVYQRCPPDQWPVGAIPRSRQHFGWAAGPGILMLDYDPSEAAVTREELLRQLRQAVPELESQEMLWRPSASSCIYETASGRELSGIRGQRVYLLVERAADIPTVGALIYQRCWLAGFGWIKVSRVGALLDRTLVDRSVWQPERLDFVAGAVCSSGLVQKLPAPVLVRGARAVLRSTDLTPLTGAESGRYKTLIESAKRRLEADPTVLEIRDAYAAKHAAKMAANAKIDVKEAEHILRQALSSQDLESGFVLHSQHHGPVTVAQLLDDPHKFHNSRFADPIEPDYDNDDRIAWANLYTGGTPFIYSHAHGGITYKLRRKRRLIRMAKGGLAQSVDECLVVLTEDSSLYEYGPNAVRLAGVTPITASDKWVEDRINRLVHLEKYDARHKTWVATDCPPSLPPIINAKQGERGFPTLRAVITAPTLRPDGSILERPGYDSSTGLLLIIDGEGDADLAINTNPGVADTRAAFEDLWVPFRQFPFATPLDRAVFVAALLTAVIRRSLPTAPAFAFDAPAAGSGKTLLARIIAGLATGREPGLMSHTAAEEEMRKRLFAKLLENAGVIVIDNIGVGQGLRSDSLASFLTSLNYSDRILGESRSATLPNTSLVLITGNNVAIEGDLVRRVLRSRIDPKVERPYARKFDVDPLDYVLRNRQLLVRHALTILRGYLSSGRGPVAENRVASYETWSDIVRSTALWLGELGVIEHADPIDSVDLSMSLDPDRGKLSELLGAWHAVFGSDPVFLRQVTAYVGTANSINDSMLRLTTAVTEIIGQKAADPPRNLGAWIHGKSEQIVAGYRLVRGKMYQGSARWTVEQVSPMASPDKVDGGGTVPTSRAKKAEPCHSRARRRG